MTTRALQALAVLVMGFSFLSVSEIAQADTTYWPPNPNGFRVYLSQACHDPNLGDNCIDNEGCDGFSENTRSRLAAVDVKDNLIARGYPVRIGNGGAIANVASSDQWNADLHVPLHSNAIGSQNCVSDADASIRGTQPQFRGPNAEQIAIIAKNWIGDDSPGTRDRKDFNDTNYENRAPNAIPLYLESEYHDWVRGVNWLRHSDDWALASRGDH